MHWLATGWERIQAFMEAGGPILTVIFVVTFALWTLILERYFYFSRVHPGVVQDAVSSWSGRSDKASWYAQQIRQMTIARVKAGASRSLRAIQTLIALCPLLGLLGTVSGMVEVFDVMAIAGSGNPRAMASGVYHAIMPTMSGMVAALSGMYFSARLSQHAIQEAQKLEDRLARH